MRHSNIIAVFTRNLIFFLMERHFCSAYTVIDRFGSLAASEENVVLCFGDNVVLCVCVCVEVGGCINCVFVMKMT